MRDKQYLLDLNDLQYKQIRLPRKKKIFNLIVVLAGTIIISFFYGAVVQNIFGSPKEKILRQELENMKLQYSLLGMQMNKSMEILQSFSLSDDIRYRPVLSMDSIPVSYRSPGVGGVNRNEDLYGYENSNLMISMRTQVGVLEQMAFVQIESYKSVTERSREYKREMEHIPWICPVKVTIRRGDGVKFREVHPVLGTPQWHHGQDFNAPYGTEVFATGAGRVIEAGWNSGGFGNYVVIDHGYGYRTTYGHLSSIKVSEGTDVRRGEMIGLSGSTGTSSGPHLHYQIDLFGRHKNPLAFFNDDLTAEEYSEMIETLSQQIKFK